MSCIYDHYDDRLCLERELNQKRELNSMITYNIFMLIMSKIIFIRLLIWIITTNKKGN